MVVTFHVLLILFDVLCGVLGTSQVMVFLEFFCMYGLLK